MYRTILVPLDGSPFGEHALPVAASIARHANATLYLVQVLPASAPRDGADGPAGWQPRHEAEEYLAGVADRFAAGAGLRALPRLLEGPVARTLQEYALGERADLVVMTTHGRGPVSRLWLGSVADELVQRLPVPLLLVRPHEAHARLGEEAGPRHLLVALDGTPRAEGVLGPAAELAGLTGARVRLARVVVPLPVLGVDLTGYATAATDLSVVDRLRVEAARYLEGVAAGLRGRGLRVSTQVLLHPHPATALLHEAEVHRCDLIAVGTAGRRGLPRLFLGSVADKVVRGAVASVLVHHEPAAVATREATHERLCTD